MNDKKKTLLLLLVTAAVLILALVGYRLLSDRYRPGGQAASGSQTVSLPPLTEDLTPKDTQPEPAPEPEPKTDPDPQPEPQSEPEPQPQPEPEPQPQPEPEPQPEPQPEPEPEPEPEPTPDLAPEADRAPDFSVQNDAGETVKLSDFFGKPIVVNFWATWCPPCQAELPHFDSAAAKYGDRITFMMVDLTDGSRDTVKNVRKFMADEGYTFPVYYDTEYEGVYAYGVNAIPVTLFIDARGVLVSKHVGMLSRKELTEAIAGLLQDE